MQETESHTFSEERLSPEYSEAPANSWGDAGRTQAADKRQVPYFVKLSGAMQLP